MTVLAGRELALIIDETGDKKKGNTTDYVKRQYIGNLGKVENGIVAVTAYGLCEGMTFPLTVEVYKPKERLSSGDPYESKPQIAARIIRYLQQLGFKFQLVLADSLYGESHTNFIQVLNEFHLNYAVAIRSNRAEWLPQSQSVRQNRWRAMKRIFSDGSKQTRYIREIIFGKRREVQYWLITTDPDKLPENSTWYVMTKIPGVKFQEVGNIYGLRNWIECGLKQSKNELGWANFRVTDYKQIQKWWELIMSAYLMVSLHSKTLNLSRELEWDNVAPNPDNFPFKFVAHEWWDTGTGWKNLLNNLRLIIQPFVLFNLLKP